MPSRLVAKSSKTSVRCCPVRVNAVRQHPVSVLSVTPWIYTSQRRAITSHCAEWRGLRPGDQECTGKRLVWSQLSRLQTEQKEVHSASRSVFVRIEATPLVRHHHASRETGRFCRACAASSAGHEAAALVEFSRRHRAEQT